MLQLIIFQAHQFSALFLDIDIALAKRFRATCASSGVRLRPLRRELTAAAVDLEEFEGNVRQILRIHGIETHRSLDDRLWSAIANDARFKSRDFLRLFCIPLINDIILSQVVCVCAQNGTIATLYSHLHESVATIVLDA